MGGRELSPERCLVTGAGGQLGRSLLAAAPPAGFEWVGCTRECLDVSDETAVRKVLSEVRPSVVLNAAAYTQVDRCESEPQEAWRVNADAPGVLARACGDSVRLIHVSTEYVFPGDASRPVPEDAAVAPRSVYGESKAAGEAAVREVSERHAIVRTQWLFGEGRNFVRTILAAARGGQALRVVEDQLGRPTSTDALALALTSVVTQELAGTLHLACEGIASWFDLACEIVEHGAALGMAPSVPVEPVGTEAFPRPAHRPAYGVLGLTRARAHGIRLPHWRLALRRYLERELEREREGEEREHA